MLDILQRLFQQLSLRLCRHNSHSYQFIELRDSLRSREDFLCEVGLLVGQEERVEPLEQGVVNSELDVGSVADRLRQVAWKSTSLSWLTLLLLSPLNNGASYSHSYFRFSLPSRRSPRLANGAWEPT